MPKMTQDIHDFTAVVLSKIPKPYSEDITLDVFLKIERDERLQNQYQQLVDKYSQIHQDGRGTVNTFIGKYVKKITGRIRDDHTTPAPQSSLITAYSKLF